MTKQECISVGCVLPACWPYPVVLGGGGSGRCLSRGMSAQGGVCLGGGYLSKGVSAQRDVCPRRCMPRGMSTQGVSSQEVSTRGDCPGGIYLGVSVWEGGVSAWRMSVQGRGWCVPRHPRPVADTTSLPDQKQTPPPQTRGRHPSESQTGVKAFPSCNFVCGR